MHIDARPVQAASLASPAGMEPSRGSSSSSRLSVARAGAPGVLALVVGGVHAAEHQLAALMVGVVAIQPEGEDWLLDYALIHHIVEGRHSTLDGDAGEAQALQALVQIRAKPQQPGWE